MNHKISKNFFIIFILGIFLFLFFVPFVNAFSVSDYQNKYNSEPGCEHYNSEIKGNCYGFFASQKNDIDYCSEAWEKAFEKETAQLKYLGADSSMEQTVSMCITRFSIDKNNVGYCNTLEKEDLKQECMADYYIFKNEISGCSKITNKLQKNRCFKGFIGQKIYQIYGYLFYIYLLGLIVLTIVFIKLKFNTLKILNIFSFILVPFFVLLRGCYFVNLPLSKFRGLQIYLSLLGEFGQFIDLYFIILLFYVIFCCILTLLNIRHAFKEVEKNNSYPKGKILLSILISFVAIVILFSSSGSYAQIVWAICTFLFLISIEIASVKYSIKLKLLNNNQYKSFTKLSIIIGIILIFWLFSNLFMFSYTAGTR